MRPIEYNFFAIFITSAVSMVVLIMLGGIVWHLWNDAEDRAAFLAVAAFYVVSAVVGHIVWFLWNTIAKKQQALEDKRD